MYIIGKSAVNCKQMQGKLALCRNLELQLLDEVERGVKVEQLIDEIHKSNDYAIRAVHSPLIHSLGDKSAVNLNEIQDEAVMKRLVYTLELAGIISDEQKFEVLVVVHNTGTLDDFLYDKELSNLVCNVLTEYMEKYPYISIGIENVTPFYIKQARCKLKNGCLFENVDIAQYLQSELEVDKKRIGTVLDVCHSKIMRRVMQGMFADTDLWVPTELEYFANNQDVIKEIHLANVKGIGIPHENHGIAYDDTERVSMFAEMALYRQFNYTCNVTIEIRENDYVLNENFKHNYKMLKGVCKELNIPVMEA